jgi:hypothetical protein
MLKDDEIERKRGGRRVMMKPLQRFNGLTM